MHKKAVRLLLVCLLVAGSTIPSAEAAERRSAGVVEKLQGSAEAQGLVGVVPLSVGALVFEDDIIRTGSDSRVALTMVDEATLTLGPDSEFAIEDYLFVGPGEGSVAMRLLKGSFRAVSGLIKGGQGEAFAIHTPVATIGIRGTDFWGGKLDGAFNFALLEGAAIYVENAAGRVEIDQVGYGTTVEGPDSAPTPPVEWAADKVGRAVDSVRFR